MRCRICDAILAPNEIQYNNNHKEHDPCTKCLQIIEDIKFKPTSQELELMEEDLTAGLELDNDDDNEELHYIR